MKVITFPLYKGLSAQFVNISCEVLGFPADNARAPAGKKQPAYWYASVKKSALQALQKAAVGLLVLLILDDVWQLKHVPALNACLDAQTLSRTMVTTRVQGLVAGAVEVPLGLLPPDEAAGLLPKRSTNSTG